MNSELHNLENMKYNNLIIWDFKKKTRIKTGL